MTPRCVVSTRARRALEEGHVYIGHFRAACLALRAALGPVKLADLTRAKLDELCDAWRALGVEYPERNLKLHRLRPITGASCNRLLAVLSEVETRTSEIEAFCELGP